MVRGVFQQPYYFTESLEIPFKWYHHVMFIFGIWKNLPISAQYLVHAPRPKNVWDLRLALFYQNIPLVWLSSFLPGQRLSWITGAPCTRETEPSSHPTESAETSCHSSMIQAAGTDTSLSTSLSHYDIDYMYARTRNLTISIMPSVMSTILTTLSSALSKPNLFFDFLWSKVPWGYESLPKLRGGFEAPFLSIDLFLPLSVPLE